MLESHFSEICDFNSFCFCEPIVFQFYARFRFFIVLVWLVLEGGLASLYGIVWSTYTCRINVMTHFVVPSFASAYAMSGLCHFP